MIDKKSDYVNAQSQHVQHQLNRLITHAKRTLLQHALISLLPWLIVIAITGLFFKLSTGVLVITLIILVVSTLLFKIKSARYQQITLANVLLHINRTYPQLEESAQLVCSNEDSLSLLQKLQKIKVNQLILQLLSDNKPLLPQASYQNSLRSAMLAVVVLLTLYLTHEWLLAAKNAPQNTNPIIASDNGSQVTTDALYVTESEIVITPPTYTQFKVRQQKSLNASVIAGTSVRWKVNFNHSNQQVFIAFSGAERAFLTLNNDLSYSTEQVINATGIYRLGVVINGVEKMLPDIYTLTVTQDKKPKIKIISPKPTITEIATHSATVVTTHVQISDDFKVNKVEILASIAKGSGEAVKFRDEVFYFDAKQTIDGIENYYKSWQLTDLKMAPGDELYFTVKAWDNREPKAQLASSNTKIIRWLENETQAVLSDGVLIDFMPEYFKSQRQIIIETLALINDKAELKSGRFSQTSELLGIAQRDLKEKYGQYLGDEVEDGGGSHAASDEASEEISHLSAEEGHDNEHAHEHGHEGPAEHASDNVGMTKFGADKSGASELINQFGHNHEEADIGIMARQDPKALMKRSINNMWQAELHLMLSQPSKALPYEYQALKYLKMAKKAERIYVKRLGFEPPPVSEQRRYQGELTDIVTNKSYQTIDLSNSEYKQLSDLYTWLNTVLNKQLSPALTSAQRQLVVQAKTQFETLLKTRPALIKYVAIFERILIDNSAQLSHCSTCLADLVEKVGQLLPKVIAKPMLINKPYSNSDVLSKHYAEFLSEQR